MSNSNLKCLYIYDHRFINHLGKIYSRARMTNSVFSRYITPRDKLTVISRMEFCKDSEAVQKASKITLKNINFKPIDGLSFSKSFSVHIVKNLTLFMKEIEQADYIVTRLPSFLGIFGLMLNKYFKRKYFIEVVGDAEEALKYSKDTSNMRFKIFTYMFYKLNQHYIKNADGVIYVTKETLQKKYPSKGHISFASNVQIEIAEKKLTESQYSLKNNECNLGMIADYNNHYKGIKDAIKAIKILKDEGYNITLNIVGSGAMLNYYQNMATNLGVNESIIFKGRLKGNLEIFKFLESIDIYIQPSYTEGLPRALIEAMSVGLPAVATDVGGIPELLEKQYLVKPRNPVDLANKIAILIDSQTLRFKSGLNNYYEARDYDQSLLDKRRKEFWEHCRTIVEYNLKPCSKQL